MVFARLSVFIAPPYMKWSSVEGVCLQVPKSIKCMLGLLTVASLQRERNVEGARERERERTKFALSFPCPLVASRLSRIPLPCAPLPPDFLLVQLFGKKQGLPTCTALACLRCLYRCATAAAPPRASSCRGAALMRAKL
jgi:hypothetical protein